MKLENVFVLIMIILVLAICCTGAVVLYVNDINSELDGYKKELNISKNKFNDEHIINLKTSKLKKQNEILYKESLKEIIKEISYKVDPSLIEQIAIEAIKNKDILDPLFTICIIAAESSFRPDIDNEYGAIGLMQVVPKFHSELMLKHKVHPFELYHVSENIKIGTRVFREYLFKYKDFNKAMQKYCGASNSRNAKKYIDKIVPKYIQYKLRYKILPWTDNSMNLGGNY